MALYTCGPAGAHTETLPTAAIHDDLEVALPEPPNGSENAVISSSLTFLSDVTRQAPHPVLEMAGMFFGKNVVSQN